MIKSRLSLTDKEIVELRIKIMEPLIMTASKHDLEKSRIPEIAEKHWEFAIKPILKEEAKE